MGDCPVYTVSIYDDGLVQWKGKAFVGKKGAARGQADPAKVKQLVAAFVAARFLEMDSNGDIPAPLPPGSMGKIESACTDTSHAITTFRQGPGKKQSRKIDNAHCKGANALSALEKQVDEVAGTMAFINAPVDKFACKANNECGLSCEQGAVNLEWYRQWRAKHLDCDDGCSSVGMSARCVKHRCAAFSHDDSPDAGCTARP
jgi:hypothetical protein